MPETAAGPRADGLWVRWTREAAVTARRHWLMALLLTAGLVLRILVQIAYRPALFYIDTIKYLYGAYPGNDPPGYQFFLDGFLKVGNLDMVAGFQHLLGLGMAVALYALLLRRGAARWLAALATVPILLDGYQLQVEQTIMPDVLFEAFLVAGLVVLLWRERPQLWMLAVGGLLLGCSAPMWQPGEILILPAVAYALLAAHGWRARIGHAAVVGAAFLVPIVLISARNQIALKHFSLAPYAASTIYGRMAYAADCATLKLPAYERPLCVPRSEALKLGPDGLDHAVQSPLKHLTLPRGMAQHTVATNFAKRVLEQQPLRVIGSILGDAVKLFEVHRVTSAGDTPISRWQFQVSYPTYKPYVTIKNGLIQFAVLNDDGQPVVLGNGLKFGGGPPKVITPIARFLRHYQLDGGYTPGPLLLFTLIAGLIGSAFLLVRRKYLGARDWAAARACCFVLACGVCVLLLSDAFEFSWRYQLPALMTFPPAGALGITVIIGFVRRRRQAGPAGARPVMATAPAEAAAAGATVTSATAAPPGTSAAGASPAGADGDSGASTGASTGAGTVREPAGEGMSVPEQPTGR